MRIGGAETNVFNLTRTQQYLLVALAAVLVLTASCIYWRHIASSRQAIIIEPNAAETAPDNDYVVEAEPKEIVVHVAGAVKQSGVYSLAEGSRVIDAIIAAGQAEAEADLDAINLAQPLVDGQRVWVPKKGEQAGSNPGGEYVDVSFGTAKVNINTANLVELQTLSGIGPSLAQRIIDFRAQNGPFKQIEDIMNVSGIGEKRFEQLKNHITVY